jgi:hypothetical protein
MMVAEMRFRTLDAPELVAKVIGGTQYEDGEEIQEDRGTGSPFYVLLDNSFILCSA